MPYFERHKKLNIPLLSIDTGVSVARIHYLIRAGVIPNYDLHRQYSQEVYNTIMGYLKGGK